MATRAKPTGTRSKAGAAVPTAPAPTVAPKRTTRAAAAAKTTPTEHVAATSTRRQVKPRSNVDEPTPPKAASRPVSKRSAGDAVEAIPRPKAVQQPSILLPVADNATDRESLQAYLRIRPNAAADDEDGAPYLTALSDTVAEMNDRSPGFRIRPAQLQGGATYTFSRVFKPEVSQKDFFANTTLPLVRSLLDGESGLLFAYGVTNSGKTYTIQGGTGDGEAGVLPRALDVVFNSIDGLQSKAPLRPARLNDVEYDPTLINSARSSQVSVESAQPFDFATLKADQGALDGLLDDDIDSFDIDDTVFKVDRNYEYAVWISYAEVYNEKIYDLLGDSSPARATTSVFSFASNNNLAALASTDANHPLLLKRRALMLKNDPDSQGKYISGLREVRVRTREEARAVVKLGQLNRRVFGTMANAASSRSHSVFTVRLIRVHGGSPTAEEAHCARLSIVDLAGSERMKNTGAAGERLREAGAINKSLMVLGQCMEIMRANQRRLALAAGSSVPPKLAMVPFRHSKLTEIFIDFFTGGGRAAMIVNVNPYDTGFDENSHVMKFAALAKEVSTGTVRRPTPKTGDRSSTVRRVTVSMGGSGGKRPTEAHLEIVEEDPEDTVVEDDEPVDGLVEALFEQIQELRMKLLEAEVRSADIESDIREEVVDEMQERFLSVQQKFAQRMLDMEEENDLRTEAKLDMLRDAGVFKPTQPCQTCAARRRADKMKAVTPPSRVVGNETEEEDEVGSILKDSDDETEQFDLDNVDGGSETEEPEDDDDDSDAEDPPSSPLAGRSSSVVRLTVDSRIEGSIGLLGSDAEDESDAEETASYLESESGDEDEDEEDMLDSDEEGSRDRSLDPEDQYDPSVVASSRRTTLASEYSDFTHQSELSLHSLELSPIPVAKQGRVSDASELTEFSPPPTVKKPAKKKVARVSYTTTDVSEMSPPPTVKKAAGKKKVPRASETSVDELDFLSPQRPRRSARPTKR